MEIGTKRSTAQSFKDMGNEAFKKAYKRLLSSTLRLSRLIPRTTFCHTIGHSRVCNYSSMWKLAENPAARLSSDVEWQGDSSTNGTMPSSFGALQQRRQKKEEKSSGILCARDHNTSISSPTDVTGISSKSAETNPHSASTYSIPPIRSFADFEMRWCMSSEPERRCSVLESAR
ncbi:hypothetical protein MJO28_009281 [Puccinia striiformis f. sp. tritici]|uniref:Uncharacterized protein n=1 Tax=Puccinia striiformis f. sp. tritici TaxID=168172 RepID=A0ACC0E7C2_9BASI|nr:hypothetical protein MJO28_009281 [Puccinia striiformis f. sp. tritici]